MGKSWRRISTVSRASVSAWRSLRPGSRVWTSTSRGTRRPSRRPSGRSRTCAPGRGSWRSSGSCSASRPRAWRRSRGRARGWRSSRPTSRRCWRTPWARGSCRTARSARWSRGCRRTSRTSSDGAMSRRPSATSSPPRASACRTWRRGRGTWPVARRPAKRSSRASQLGGRAQRGPWTRTAAPWTCFAPTCRRRRTRSMARAQAFKDCGVSSLQIARFFLS
mmetsp:Transcript_36796/g.106075  ORF Transcript_36796/g.106075 Transcript_36796/m.106075 type:complete len:221 (-) Transcript_36796:274-936(-)